MNKLVGLALILVLLCLAAAYFLFNGKGSGTTYVGTLPGADCAGLKTELTLYENNTYYLKETYLATRDGDKTFTSTGQWQKRIDGRSFLIQLNYDHAELTNYLVVDKSSIRLVDKQGKDIDCPFNLTLIKKK